MLLKINILLTLVGLSVCAVWQSELPPMPEKFAGKEGCYIKEIDEVVPFGSTVTPIGHCYRVGCGQMLFYASCGSVATNDPKCYVAKEDLTKPYPECCPHVECVDDNTV